MLPQQATVAFSNVAARTNIQNQLILSTYTSTNFKLQMAPL
jgi:hypothetical protein